ncbi:MAG: DUF5060 domain-containing protein [Lachnospiraceae bacterium]|nr:DUF5060 domain-containing protein [Lachnospiraceae bacterium]
MEQYRMCELEFQGEKLDKDWAQIDLAARLWCDGKELNVPGFYAGDGVYKVRFLPEAAGLWQYEVSGCIESKGSVEVEAAQGAHGIVKAEEQHFVHQDGTYYYPFGTTVYALIHQEEDLIAQTMESLRNAPFNKVRFCVFPKHYDYNHNEPQDYAFEKKEDGSWDVNQPCFAFWNRLDEIILQMGEMGIQADLILFHPYDRWGFSKMPQADNLIYLDYLTRRLAAMPNVWWSLANEYDLCAAKSMADWEEIEGFVAEHDPCHHLLSNHNCFKNWDYARPHVTHVSIQSKAIKKVLHWRKIYQKPVVVDECCYEGNLQHFWGSISGREMTNRFWRVVTMGGYCTHGETFLDPEKEILWWAKGGILKGDSPARIAFLRNIVEGLPGPIAPVEPRLAVLVENENPDIEAKLKEADPAFAFFAKAMLNMGKEFSDFYYSEFIYQGHCGEDAYLTFYDLRTCAKDVLELPEGHTYRVELIDTWEMKRTVLLEQAGGKTELTLPGKEGMAVLAVRTDL